MPDLSISDTTLKYDVGRLLGWGPVAQWTQEDNDDYAAIKRTALHQFYWPSVEYNDGRPHVWSFLTPTYTLTTDAPYATGTVTASSGVVTLTGGIWPSWAAEGEVEFGGSVDGPYEISTRDSDTQITLVDTDVDIASAVSFAISRYKYDLPSNYGGKFGPLTFRTADLAYRIKEVEFIGYEDMRVKRQNWTTDRTYPRLCCEALQRVQREGALNTALSELQTRELWLYPNPDAVYFMSMRYMINPQTLDSDDILGAELYPLAVQTLVMAEAERSKDHPTPKYQEQAHRALMQAIRSDRTRYAPDTSGKMEDHSDLPLYHDFEDYHRVTQVTHDNDA